MLTALLISSVEDLASLAIGYRVGTAGGRNLVVLCPRKDTQAGLDQAKPESEGQPELVGAVLEWCAAQGVVLPVYDCRGPKPERSVLAAVAELGATDLVLLDSLEGGGIRALNARLLRVAPVHVVLLEGGEGLSGPQRVLVPQLGGGGGHTIRYAARYLGAERVPVCALADPRAISRSRRVYTSAKERLSSDRHKAMTQEEPSGTIEDRLRELIEPGDLVLFDAEEVKRVKEVSVTLRELRRERPGEAFALGLTRAEHAVGPGRFERFIERIRLHAPTLSRDQRREVYLTLEKGGQLSTDFVMMLMMSASIAALGLIQSSTAVVIGAMLVAPLMTPLLAIGMSLVQGNIQMFRRAWRAVVIGVLGALLASMAIALLSPWDELSAEVVARGAPNPFDLLIALLSGVAAAFALARPGLAGTLVGVAIAVALVPPLAAVGISTVKGELGMAGGAAMLFLTNLLAIIIGAALVFRFFGFDASLRGRKAPKWVAITLVVLIGAMFPTTAALMATLQDQVGQGVSRPYARPLPRSMRDRIVERVEQQSGAEILMMAESAIEHGFGREVVVLVNGPVDPTLEEDLLAILRAGTNASTPVRVLMVPGISASGMGMLPEGESPAK